MSFKLHAGNFVKRLFSRKGNKPYLMLVPSEYFVEHVVGYDPWDDEVVEWWPNEQYLELAKELGGVFTPFSEKKVYVTFPNDENALMFRLRLSEI